jgi:hypothetical protein
MTSQKWYSCIHHLPVCKDKQFEDICNVVAQCLACDVLRVNIVIGHNYSYYHEIVLSKVFLIQSNSIVIEAD